VAETIIRQRQQRQGHQVKETKAEAALVVALILTGAAEAAEPEAMVATQTQEADHRLETAEPDCLLVSQDHRLVEQEAEVGVTLVAPPERRQMAVEPVAQDRGQTVA
jgi:hypothetical protein